MPKTARKQQFSQYITYSKWQAFLAIASLGAIVLYLLLKAAGISDIFNQLPLLLMILVGGIPSVVQILKKMLKGDLGADLLAVIAIITAIYLHEHLAATLIILMLTGGQALETYAMRKASSVLLALAKRMPFHAHRRIGKQIEDIAITDIRVGDQIIIYPHEICPVDGTVLEGHGAMDESYLTGEPYHISKTPGVTVLSGAVNGESTLVIQATKLASDSRYAKIVAVLAEAEQKRPHLRRLGDQLGAIFAPIALIGALGAWYFSGEAVRFLAVLVIATPCPLLIAIPITIISTISLAARRGILINDPTVLERLPTCRTAIFDKTGTLTYGQPELTEILTTHDPALILQQVASLERYSKHPLASAFLKAAKKAKLNLLEAASVSEKPGQGLLGRISNQEILVTHRQKLAPEMLKLLPPVSEGLECIILINGAYAATCRFRDQPRQEGHSFIHHLIPAHQFDRILLVSGDRESEVKYLAALMGIKEFWASQSPEQKVTIVQRETAKAPTLYVGDGVNDAPALAVATVGVAFGRHNDVIVETAGAVIMDNTLVKMDELLHISDSTRRIALESALGGMLLSIIGMGFAAMGLIPPVYGALLQEVIDIFAILNALRLTWRTDIVTDIT